MRKGFRQLIAFSFLLAFLLCAASGSAERAGTFGNMAWSLGENGLLTVSGRGNMTDFTETFDSAWLVNRRDIRYLVVEPGIRSVGTFCFRECTGLKGAVLSETVLSVGAGAFSDCGHLERLYILGRETELAPNSIPERTIIYCYEYSQADVWANENGYAIIYLENYNSEDERVLEVFESSFTLSVGDTLTLDPFIFPDYDQPGFSMVSSNSSVAKIEDGAIRIVGPGIAVVTVASGSAYDKVILTALDPMED